MLTEPIGFPPDFPADCYFCIFTQLTLKELITASRVSKLWYSLSQTESLWKHFALKDCPEFPKEKEISWIEYYRKNIQGSRIGRLHYTKNGLVSAWGKAICLWKQKIVGRDEYYQCSTTMTDHKGSIRCFFAFVNGVDTSLVTGSADKTIKLWRKKYEEKDFQLISTAEGHRTPVNVLTGNYSNLFSGSEDGEIRWWKYSFAIASFETVATMQAHNCAITALETGNQYCVRSLFSGYQDGTLVLWKKTGSTFQIGQKVEGLHKGKITSLSYNSLQQLLFSSSADKTIRVWRKNLFKLHCIFKVEAHASPVTDILPYKNSENFLTTGKDGTLTNWRKKESSDPEYALWEKEQCYLPETGIPLLAVTPRLASPWTQFDQIFALNPHAIIKLSFQDQHSKPQLVKSVCRIPLQFAQNGEEMLEIETAPCEIVEEEE